MKYVFRQVGRLYLIILMDQERVVSAYGTTNAYAASRKMEAAIAQKQIKDPQMAAIRTLRNTSNT